MAWYPHALRKPITAKKRARMRWYRRVNLHVAVSEASSLFGYFNQRGIADSHFYVRKDGTVEQMVDTAFQAYADLQGNDATISIETQGGLHNTQSEKWTAAQLASLADIYAWAVKTHGIPLKIARDSIPTGTSSHGLSWHRLGIDGNFPSGILHGRVAGGMHYSTSRGKVCPGNAKIRQVDDMFARAQQILKAAPSRPADKTPPAPPKDWFDMASEADLRKIVRAEVDRALTGVKVPIFGALKTYSGSDDATLTSMIRYAANSMPDGRNQHADLRARLAALQAALKELAKNQGLDADKIDAAINKAVKDALSDLKITLTTED